MRTRSKIILLILTIAVFWPMVINAQEETLQGKRIYELKCSRCHSLYSPQKYSLDEWETILKEMSPISGMDEEDEKAVLEYLGRETKDKEKSGLPTSPVLAGYLYTEFFSSKDSVDTFDLHYLNFNISGRIHERVSYKAEFELEHGGGKTDPPFVEQAYLDLNFFRGVGLKIGAILTPFNRFDELHGPMENLLVTRPQMSREIGVSAWKEVGIDLHGNISLNKNLYLLYDAYIINGLGDGSRLRKSRQYKDNNDAKSMGFRLSGVIADKIEAGISIYRGAWDDDGNFDLSMLGFHLLGKIGDLSLHAEYSKANSENPSPLEKGKSDGFFVQGSYLIQGKFRPTIRYGTLDYFDQGDLLGRQPTDYDRNVLALGFNYYLSNSVVFKFEYDINGEGDRKDKKDNNLLALQAAVRF